jgi:hypothetical protein
MEYEMYKPKMRIIKAETVKKTHACNQKVHYIFLTVTDILGRLRCGYCGRVICEADYYE